MSPHGSGGGEQSGKITVTDYSNAIAICGCRVSSCTDHYEVNIYCVVWDDSLSLDGRANLFCAFKAFRGPARSRQGKEIYCSNKSIFVSPKKREREREKFPVVLQLWGRTVSNLQATLPQMVRIGWGQVAVVMRGAKMCVFISCPVFSENKKNWTFKMLAHSLAVSNSWTCCR